MVILFLYHMGFGQHLHLYRVAVFYSQDGHSMYLQNFGNTVYIHRMQRPKNRININNEPM